VDGVSSHLQLWTGAGKSTLLNALLGCSTPSLACTCPRPDRDASMTRPEGCSTPILPTSCMRACTAAVIELAWPDADCSGPYEARVSLVSREEWREALLAACAAAVSAGPGKTPQVGELTISADLG